MKKILPYILISFILVGLFSPMVKVSAQSPSPEQLKSYKMVEQAAKSSAAQDVLNNPNASQADKDAAATQLKERGVTPTSTATGFQKDIDNGCYSWNTWTFSGCVLKFFYYTYFQLPTFVLWLSAQFFNVLIPISLGSTMISNSSFIPEAWAVIRDFSNILFILILLYVAFETILGIGHETKKVIVNVIIMALLINFSMFFTKVIIDSSNILALVFYNKLEVKTGTISATSKGEKDVTGEMYKKFDVTRLMTGESLNKLKEMNIAGAAGDSTKVTEEGSLPFGLTMGIMFIAGTIMLFAAYTFFIAGFSFLGRFIELWILIIFSPFAFMSYTLPVLADVKYIGWKSWTEKLLATSFMAPIFLFFLYLIFKLLPTIEDFYKNESGTQGAISLILSIMIPALVILALLNKATSFAKKGGGYFGEMLMKGASIVGGLAVGAATGGVAALGTSTFGKHYAGVANDDKLKAGASGNINDETREHFAKLGVVGDDKIKAFSQKKLAKANAYANSSFDFRQTGLGKFTAKASGMDFNAGTGALGLSTKDFEGGRKGQVKREAEAEEKKFKTYKLSGSAADKQKVRNDQYVEDKKKAESFAKENGFNFKEENFEKDYREGKNLNEHGLNKKVEVGDYRSVDEINSDRRSAYANSQIAKGDKEKSQNAVRRFLGDWKEGMNNAERGFLTKTALGVASLGSVQLTEGFLHALKGVVKPRATDTEVTAAVGKGVKSSIEEALHHLDEARGLGHGGETHTPEAHPEHGGGNEAQPTHTPAHPEPAHTPTENHGGAPHAGN